MGLARGNARAAHSYPTHVIEKWGQKTTRKIDFFSRIIKVFSKPYTEMTCEQTFFLQLASAARLTTD
jgi:hypothetical protein